MNRAFLCGWQAGGIRAMADINALHEEKNILDDICRVVG